MRTPPADRRRAHFGAAVLAAAIGGAVIAGGNVLTGPGGVPATAAGAGTAAPARTVRVRTGDSLWSIATRFRGRTPIGRYVEALISANGGTRIEAGQIVRLP